MITTIPLSSYVKFGTPMIKFMVNTLHPYRYQLRKLSTPNNSTLPVPVTSRVLLFERDYGLGSFHSTKCDSYVRYSSGVIAGLFHTAWIPGLFDKIEYTPLTKPEYQTVRLRNQDDSTVFLSIMERASDNTTNIDELYNEVLGDNRNDSRDGEVYLVALYNLSTVDVQRSKISCLTNPINSRLKGYF